MTISFVHFFKDHIVFYEKGASDLIEKGVAIPKSIVDINHIIISYTHHCAQFRKGISQTDDNLLNIFNFYLKHIL
jgi:hypothetical protein